MDEQEFKATHSELNERPCVFAKAILARCGGCHASRKLLIAEREAIHCVSPGGHNRCGLFLGTLRRNALFALHLTRIDGPLPHGKEMKVQCGGLLGLQQAIDPASDAATVADIDELLARAVAGYTSVESIPYDRLVTWVGGFELRKGRRHP